MPKIFFSKIPMHLLCDECECFPGDGSRLAKYYIIDFFFFKYLSPPLYLTSLRTDAKVWAFLEKPKFWVEWLCNIGVQ